MPEPTPRGGEKTPHEIIFADVLTGLRCSGLVRRNGDLVALTHAAVNAHELLMQ